MELVFKMSDFVVLQYKEGSLRYYGPTTELLLYPTSLRAPERVNAVATPAGYFLAGQLKEVPFVVNLQLELMLRPQGEMSCRNFKPDKDPYSSVLVTPDVSGRWGTTVPKIGGAICMRLSGGGWHSAIIAAALPN